MSRGSAGLLFNSNERRIKDVCSSAAPSSASVAKDGKATLTSSAPQEPWNRLQQTPSSFPTPPAWPRALEPDRTLDKRDSLISKEEHERCEIQINCFIKKIFINYKIFYLLLLLLLLIYQRLLTANIICNKEIYLILIIVCIFIIK